MCIDGDGEERETRPLKASAQVVGHCANQNARGDSDAARCHSAFFAFSNKDYGGNDENGKPGRPQE